MAKLKPSSAADNHVKLRSRIKQLSILHNIARAVISVLDLQSVLKRIVDAAVFLTGAEEGFLMLVDEASQELHLRAGKGLGDKAAKVMRVPVNDGLSGQVMRSGKPLRMGGKQTNAAYKVKTGYLVKSILKVPIKGQNKILGVLSVDHAIESFKTFSDHDVSLLTSLAGYAAIAIDNAQRFEQATQRADELSQALKEAGAVPDAPTRDSDREALRKFNEGLRLQRQEVTKVQQEAQTLAKELYGRADTAAEIAEQLEVWNEKARNLLPQLDWIAQTALARKATGQLIETADQDEVLSIIDILLNNLTPGILLCNAEGTIIQASASVEGIFERPKDNIINSQLQNLFPDDAHWEHLVGSLRLALALGNKRTPPPPQARTTFYQGDKVIQASLFPLNKYRNQGIAIVAVVHDLSLETAGWRVRDETVNALSESLRTPLSAVHTYGDMLLNESVGLITTAQRRYLQRIRGGVDQMEEILMRFITLLKDDLVSLQTKQANLKTAFNDAICAAREELTLAGVQLVTDIDQTLPPVHVAPEFFTRVMTDLLIKAGSYVQPGGVMILKTEVQRGENQPDYLVVGIGNEKTSPQIEQNIKDDPDIKTIAKAVQYQGGRIWNEVDYQGRWKVSFLLPAAN